jgi:DNA-binding transcriptional LysR family regulator
VSAAPLDRFRIEETGPEEPRLYQCDLDAEPLASCATDSDSPSTANLVAPYAEQAAWLPVLEEFSTPFPGFYLYYPQRRHASPALRALIDYLRSSRG